MGKVTSICAQASKDQAQAHAEAVPGTPDLCEPVGLLLRSQAGQDSDLSQVRLVEARLLSDRIRSGDAREPEALRGARPGQGGQPRGLQLQSVLRDENARCRAVVDHRHAFQVRVLPPRHDRALRRPQADRLDGRNGNKAWELQHGDVDG